MPLAMPVNRIFIFETNCMSISHFRFKDIAECERNVAPFYFVLSNKGKKIEGTCKFILPFLFPKHWLMFNSLFMWITWEFQAMHALLFLILLAFISRFVCPVPYMNVANGFGSHSSWFFVIPKCKTQYVFIRWLASLAAMSVILH